MISAAASCSNIWSRLSPGAPSVDADKRINDTRPSHRVYTLVGKVEDIGPNKVLQRLNTSGFSAVEVSQIPMTPDKVAEIQAQHGWRFSHATTLVVRYLSGEPLPESKQTQSPEPDAMRGTV